ncbi:MAG: metallophosphoesterase [Xenococcaceae cyanobacterium MO_188.B32]|nr:metallophosphoesterase [Xenococcaceae cyanobacterium MO_188.B32]
MKRRNFLRLLGLFGLGLASSNYFLTARGTTPNNATEESLPLFRFVALGDVGTGNIGQLAIAEVMEDYFQKLPFAFILLTGDNIYEDGEISRIGAAFERPYRFFRQQGVPFYAVLGNHDIRTNNGIEQVNYSGYNMQGRYYTFTQDIVQFFALDTNKNASWSEQLIWLEENLASSTATWKIVFAHHPLYSSGIHGSSPKLIEKLSPLFARYGVQLYLNGHDHNYERTKPIEGTTYLTCGAGAKTRPVWNSDWTARSAARLSFATIDVYPEYLEIQGIGKNGQVFDRGKVIRIGSG